MSGPRIPSQQVDELSTINPMILPAFTAASVRNDTGVEANKAPNWPNGVIIVTDAGVGNDTTLCVSDGVIWVDVNTSAEVAA